MKKFNLFFVVLTIASMLMLSCEGGADTTKKADKKADARCGFQVIGEKVIFTFDEAIYGGQLLDELETVTVSGEFNGWDPTAADWHATKGENGIWTFETTTAKAPCGSKFKYVANDVDWMQPDTSMDQKYLTDDGFGGFNLVMACE